MEKADFEKTPANIRHNQLILLRLLSGLLLKWREIVKAAKQHPEIAHCLFDTPTRDGDPSQITKWTCKTVSKEEHPPNSVQHSTGKGKKNMPLLQSHALKAVNTRVKRVACHQHTFIPMHQQHLPYLKNSYMTCCQILTGYMRCKDSMY
ncbi:hypothetical protein TcG_04420 [Trypanosoma cruzi]|nr:hypothetical protein TcG_04420 [Trypanosoma cruzi]